MQDFSTANTWTWSTSNADLCGNKIKVEVRTAGSNGAGEGSATTWYEVTPQAATGVTLTATPGTPAEPGTDVVFTAQGQGGTGSYEYLFALKGPSTNGSIQLVQDYSSTNTWTWSTDTGDLCGNKIIVYVRSVGSCADEEAEASYWYEVAYPAVSSITLTASHQSPVLLGTTVEFTAQGAGGTGEYEYLFYLIGPSTNGEYEVVQDYSPANTWSWTTDSDDLCTDITGNKILVLVRNIGSCNDYDSAKKVSYVVNPQAATGVSLTTSAQSPVESDTSITFTAQGQGGTGSYEYLFVLIGPSTGGDYQITQEYSVSNTWNWVPHSGDIGNNKVHVAVRCSGSCNDYDATTHVDFEILPASGNNPPLAVDDAATTDEDTPIASIPVLANDTDPDGDTLVLSSFTQPTNGTVADNGDGTLSYTPNPDFNGLDSFTYTAADGNAGTSEATVDLTVNPVNDAPLAYAGADRNANTGDIVALDGSASSDADNDVLTFQWTILSQPAGSTTTLSDATVANPTMIPDVVGSYSMQLIVNDGTVDSAADTVIITAQIPMVTVPDVTNLTQTEAESQLTSAGLVLGVVSTEYSDTVPSGMVISQYPVAGSSVTETSAVDIVVSEGPDTTVQPTVTFTPTSITIAQGESTTLSWTSQGGNFAHIDNGIGSVATSGSTSVAPQYTTTYTLTVTGPGGSTSARAVVYVSAPPTPQPEGSFGEHYEDLIPADATVESYDHYRFSVITGLIRDVLDNPLSGVNVSVSQHPEYGTTTTDLDGRFSLPVEGGGHLTISCQSAGYIAVQRKVFVPWNDIASIDTFQMLEQDTAATQIQFNGDPQTTITHRSSMTTDNDGSRAVTMVFSGDTNAYLVDENGNVAHALNTIVTRATEYATPKTMPAELPPNSGFTYCTELTVDGAQRVQFDKPVIVWVENFLGVGVGTPVPSGYYDRDKSLWVPAQNGIVVELLDTDSDGVVDAVDADGDGQPDDLDADGSLDDEAQGLEDSATYQPGATFWRMPITHFSPWDFNYPVRPPSDAIAPNSGMASSINFKDSRFDCNKRKISSLVDDRTCIYHEDIPIPGTDMTLHYASNRTNGYKVTSIVVPVSGDQLPASLDRIDVKVQVGGQTLTQTFSPLPNQFATFEWDGMDVYGNPADRIKALKISVGYVYPAQYGTPASGSSSFARAGLLIMPVPTRSQIIIWQHEFVSLRLTNGVIADGWTLSDHHHLNPEDPTVLHKGDGTILEPVAPIIKTYAGTQTDVTQGYGDGGPAYDSFINNAQDMAVDAVGNTYIATMSRIRKVDTDGIITTVAGGGSSTADGILAVDAQLSPSALAVDPQGNIYVSETARVRMIDTNGIITTVAGTGQNSFSGDGGPALNATFNGITDLAYDSDGNLYIADQNNFRVRKIDPSGTVTTYAGNGVDSYAGIDVPATQASIQAPFRIAVGPNGDVYISQRGTVSGSNTPVIRRVDSAGIITNIVIGRGFTGDGGPASQARIWAPDHISVDALGNIFFVDSLNYRVRKIDTRGIIDTVAGNGSTSYNDSGIPATESGLIYWPVSVTAGANGDLFIGFSGDSRIVKVGWPSSFKAFTDQNDIPFAEDNGLIYSVSPSGLHRATYDQHTGVILKSFEYDTDNKLTGIVDQFGNRITLELDALGNTTAIVSPDGIRTALTIDSNNHLRQVTFPDTTGYAFDYTADGLMTIENDPKLNQFDHAYGNGGLITDVWDQELGHWQYDRQIDPLGYIETTVTTAAGNVTSYRDSVAATDSYAYTVTLPTGDENTVTKSSDGLSLTKSLASGMTLRWDSSVDTQYQYEYTKGMTITSPSGLTRQIDRAKTYEDTDSDGTMDLITETIALNNKTKTTVQDTLSAQIVSTSPEQRMVTQTYDPNTLLPQSVSVPGLNQTDYGYDTRGRLTSVTNGTRQITLAYNTDGFVGSITDQDNRTVYYTYDSLGRVTGINRPDNSQVGFSYDANGNMEILTNPANIDHSFSYNHVDRPSSYQTPLSGSYSYQYDADRRLVQSTFPSGQQIINVYTTTQLTQVQTPEGNIDFTYAYGNTIESMTKGSESIAFTYDGSLPTGVTLSGTLNQNLSFAYNDDFQLVGFTYAGGTQNYIYDLDGLLTGAGSYTITRNTQNGLPETVYGGALSINRTFNGYGELDSQNTTVGGNTALQWMVARNDQGRITQKTETAAGITSNYVYTYDPLGRLETVTLDGALVESYSYDTDGTRLTETNALRGIANRSFGYSDEDHLLSAGSVIYSYDLDGFLGTKTDGSLVTAYDYSLRGELMQVDLPDGTIIDYASDPMGRRIAKRVNGTVVERYLWQGVTRLLAIYDGSNNLIQRFEYADGRMPVSMTMAGATYYLAYDQVGSLRVVTDASGNVVKRIDYDSFGNIITDTNTSMTVPFGFAGGLHDRDTGLVRFGFRDYDPEIGRWTSKDPIGFEGGDTDLYGYVANNPVNLIDPYGLLFGLPAGEGYGESSAMYYANITTDPCASKMAKAGAWAGGLLASLWTPETSDRTFGALSLGWGAGSLVKVSGELAAEAPIVIGRGVERVRNIANTMGWEAFESTAKTSAGAFSQNMKWMLKNVKGGRNVKDIGGNLKSTYYVGEKIVKNLWKRVW